MRKTDLVIGGVALVLSLAVCYDALGMPMGTIGNPGPGFLPFWTGIALAAMSLALATRAFLERGSRTGSGAEERRSGHVAGTLAGLLFYALSLEILGYLVATFLLLSALLKILGQRGWHATLGFSALATGGSYALFSLWLGVPLPKGLIPP